MSEQAVAGNARHLRHLLPAAAAAAAVAATAGAQRKSTTISRRPSRQDNVAAACDGCRKHKAKCSGDRPVCRRCTKRRMQCHYSTQPGETPSQAHKRNHVDLRDRAQAHEEIIRLMKNLPDQEAQDIFQRLRSGTDITTILNHAKTGDLLLQLAVMPETRFRYEFPYRSEMPDEYFPDNPYLESLIFEAASVYQPAELSKRSENSFESGPANRISNLHAPEYRSLYLKPFHAAQVVDRRLIDVRPSLWTAVCDDDVLMRDLLAVFLRCEYPFTSAFQKDYFLEDMAAERTDFCSSLLVNAVLAYSCVCYPRFLNRAEYWNPRTLVYRFLAEAKRIWELEATEARLTTIHAGIVLNVFHNLSGLDVIGKAYRIHAVALANQLRFFDGGIDRQSDRIRNGWTYAAWALYDWESLTAFSFMHAPLITKPPDEPLPDPSVDPYWYGEIWVKYPSTQSLSPSYFGQVFRAKSQFRVIMNEFCQGAYSKDSAITIDRANELYSQLRNWYDTLPAPLLPRTIVLPGHLQLHMYYHHLILSIYEPLLDVETKQEPSPQKLVENSTKHLQTLVRLYYLRHGFDAMDLFIVIPLVLTGFTCVKAIDEQAAGLNLETLRSTLILITKGLYNQRRNHYLAEALYRVIRGKMRSQEAALLREAVIVDDDESSEKQALMQVVRSSWPVSVVRKKEDLDSHILTNLVENYAHMNVEDKSATVQNPQ